MTYHSLIVFLMIWHKIKHWTRMPLSPQIPRLLAINFYSLEFSQFTFPHVAAAADSSDGLPKLQQPEPVQEAQNSFGQVPSHRALC